MLRAPGPAMASRCRAPAAVSASASSLSSSSSSSCSSHWRTRPAACARPVAAGLAHWEREAPGGVRASATAERRAGSSAKLAIAAMPHCLVAQPLLRSHCLLRRVFGLSALPRRWQMRLEKDGGDEEEPEFVEAHVLSAVRMVPARNQLFMTMANGSEVEVIHVNPSACRLLYQHSTPTIFLRIADGSEVLLPIVVGDVAVGLLMDAFKQEDMARPNHYQLLRNLVNVLKYEVRHVKVTQRVVDTYHARIYLAKPGEGKESFFSVDARPSDAINLAVRCQVPIFVNKAIVKSDAIRVVAYQPVCGAAGGIRSSVVVRDAFLDSPGNGPDVLAEEMLLVTKMILAVADERYADAARVRDELTLWRRQHGRQLNKH